MHHTPLLILFVQVCNSDLSLACAADMECRLADTSFHHSLNKSNKSNDIKTQNSNYIQSDYLSLESSAEAKYSEMKVNQKR